MDSEFSKSRKHSSLHPATVSAQSVLVKEPKREIGVQSAFHMKGSSQYCVSHNGEKSPAN